MIQVFHSSIPQKHNFHIDVGHTSGLLQKPTLTDSEIERLVILSFLAKNSGLPIHIHCDCDGTDCKGERLQSILQKVLL